MMIKRNNHMLLSNYKCFVIVGKLPQVILMKISKIKPEDRSIVPVFTNLNYEHPEWKNKNLSSDLFVLTVKI